MKKIPCQTCNASHENTVERIIRCSTCKVQPVGMPTKYKLKEKNLGETK